MGSLAIQGYPSRCAANHVGVIINDGDSETFSCCPMATGVLSSVASQQYVRRNNTCAANEVLTGMASSAYSNPVLVECTSVNTQFFQPALV